VGVKSKEIEISSERQTVCVLLSWQSEEETTE